MLVSHKETGYSAHCFRCDFHPFVPHGRRSIADINRHKREMAQNYNKPPSLPKDYTLDIPVKYATWFLKCGISMELARSYGIGWSEYYHRIVLPIWKGNELVAVQMRAVNDEQQPKYLNPGGAAIRKALFWAGVPPIIDGSVPIVTEDVLSAIKIARKYMAVSTLGTTMTDERAAAIAVDYPAAILWLDNDKAGYKGTIEAARQLSMQGVKCWKVESERDPKYYTLEEIDDHLRRMKPC